MVRIEKTSLYAKVEQVLKEEPDTRNSDVALMISVWTRFYGVGQSHVALEKLYDLPQQPDIKRIRARIQNDEKRYVPTSWGVAKVRKWKEREWKRALGYYVIVDEGQQVMLLR